MIETTNQLIDVNCWNINPWILHQHRLNIFKHESISRHHRPRLRFPTIGVHAHGSSYLGMWHDTHVTEVCEGLGRETKRIQDISSTWNRDGCTETWIYMNLYKCLFNDAFIPYFCCILWKTQQRRSWSFFDKSDVGLKLKENRPRNLDSSWKDMEPK